MTNKQVLFQRIVSADGKHIAEAIASSSGSTISQSVIVKIDSGQSSSSSSSSSSSKTQ